MIRSHDGCDLLLPSRLVGILSPYILQSDKLVHILQSDTMFCKSCIRRVREQSSMSGSLYASRTTVFGVPECDVLEA